jgi:CheY-like chemotaxis protein
MDQTILVVEDDRTAREIMKEILTNLGYNILTATDGLEGLGSWTEHRDIIDLIITDFQMPSLDGKKMLKLILGIDVDIKAIIVSAIDDPETLKNIGANVVFFPKPINVTNLHRVIQSLLV